MSMTIGELDALIRADDSGMRRGLNNAELRMMGFQRDVNGRLRDLHGRFVDEGTAMGTTLGDGIARAARRGLTTLRDDADRNLLDMQQTVGDRFAAMRERITRTGEESGGGFGRGLLRTVTSTVRSGLSTALSSGMSGVQSIADSPMVGHIGKAMAIGVVATMLPFIGALLAGSVILLGGISIIGLGAALLKNEPEVKAAATSLTETAKKVFKDAAEPLIKPFSDALKKLEGTITDVQPLIDRMFVAVAPFIPPLVDGLDQLVKNVLPGFVAMLEDGQPVFDAFGLVLADLGTGLGDMFRQIGEVGPEAGQAMRDFGTGLMFLFQMIGLTIAVLATVYGQIRGFISGVYDAFVWLYDVLVGHSVVPDLVNGIVSWFTGLPGKVLGGLAAFGSSVVGVFTRAKDSAISRVRSLVDTAVTTVRGLPGRAASALGGIGSTLYNAGSRLINGFISGIKSQLGSVRSTLSNLTSMLPDWKGPASVDAKILTPAGRSLIGGFMDGIAAQVPALRGQLGGLTGGLPGMTGVSGTSAGVSAGGGTVRVIVDVTGGEDDLKKVVRNWVTVDGGGIVQTALGR